MMRTWPERSQRRARIEIIPMIDVMMFLLVFFVLISVNVLPALGLKVALPHSAAPTHLQEPRRVTITLAQDGSVFLDGQATTLEQLPEQLRTLAASSKLTVVIAGDERVILQALVSVLDALKSAGVPAASIITRPK
jgi:biopolymer transport protein ExbD